MQWQTQVSAVTINYKQPTVKKQIGTHIIKNYLAIKQLGKQDWKEDKHGMFCIVFSVQSPNTTFCGERIQN